DSGAASTATGAPLPGDVDTVIQHELSDRSDPVRFTINSIEPGHAVHPRGADARRGDLLIETGTPLGPQHIGIAAVVGKSQLAVARRPRAIVLTSGDEVLPIDQPLRDYQIRNSNGPMVRELLRRIGAEPIEHAHVADEREATIEAVGAALARCELLITVGGISAGDRDYFPASFEAHGVESSLHGAAIQPGRPIFVGKAPNGAIIIGLPAGPTPSAEPGDQLLGFSFTIAGFVQGAPKHLLFARRLGILVVMHLAGNGHPRFIVDFDTPLQISISTLIGLGALPERQAWEHCREQDGQEFNVHVGHLHRLATDHRV
ncbi:MAG: hypothetical protein IIA98_10240, partial [Proteobacteria bacterium]|nr:hypothetical protein [Pseudomonadota bacterium]